MIKFEKTDKRHYDVNRNIGTKIKKIVHLDLVFSPATNKFDKIIDFVEDCSIKLGTEFDDWFDSYLTEYIESEYDAAVIKRHVPKLMHYADKYLEECNVNFEDYVNRDKISKNSIFFDGEEIKKIIKVSNYLKLYFIISQDNIMKLPIKFHREIYNILVRDIAECNILFKLFKIVSSKTYRYNITDAYMWDYIKSIYCKTTDMHIMTIFNFINNNILVACEPTSNPIPFMIKVVDEAIRWILQSVYKDNIIYSDTINTEDTYSMQGKDNLKTYAYNDSIGRLIVLSFNYLDQEDIDEVKFNEAVKNNKECSLFSTYITYPILAKILKIPYRHFLTIPAEHGYLLNILLYHYLPEDFKEKYPTISDLLLFYNKEKVITKTTYKIKNIDHFTGSLGTFLGFKNMTFVYDFYSSIIGKLARNTYVSFKTEKEISNFPLAKLENDIVGFYNDYFDGRMDDYFEDIGAELDKIL
jgi:hypothetical protein